MKTYTRGTLGKLVGLGVVYGALVGCGVEEQEQPFIDYSYLDHAPDSDTTVCDEYSVPGIDGAPIVRTEEYNFTLLTMEIEANPHVGELAGLRSVTNCEEARAYMRTQARYLESGYREDVSDSEVSSTRQEIMGGTVTNGKRGIVQIDDNCTGWLLNSRTVVTAAHCLPSKNGTRNFRISYFDPSGGKRGITNSSESMRYWRHPSWTGGANFDIGVIKRGSAWSGTNSSDYLRVYQDSGSRMKRIRLWGAGFSTASGGGLGTLRNRKFDVDWNTYQYFITRAGRTRRACRGDSGGPAIIEVSGVDLVAGVTSTGTLKKTDRCVEQGGKQRHTRMNLFNLLWVIGVSGSSCTDASVGGFEARSCLKVTP